ncbi:MAG TPA: PhoX family phosphatase [Actinocatenispora sp.]
MTCQYRCGNACSHPVPNESGNEYFGDLATRASRRGVLRAGAVGALVVGAGAALTGAAMPAAASPATASVRPTHGLTFTPVPPNTVDDLSVPAGYDSAVLIGWGDEVVPGAPAFHIDRQSAWAQARQFGYNNDFVAVLPLAGDRALLVVNHEYTNEELMFRGYAGGETATAEQMRIAMAAHGFSVVEVERVRSTGQWRPVRHGARRHNRRLHVGTRFAVDGPAAGSPLLRTAGDPTGRSVHGTLNNCSGGVTPWGTVLTCEENVNQYFVGGDAAPEAAKPYLKRYGIETGTRYPEASRRWERADERFDLAKHPNEANRFGYVVEIDPYDVDSVPRKHTALGRFKHEAANVALAADHRAVVYLGDDERFDYLYKFVSDRRVVPGDSALARRLNRDVLTSGTLYVAKFGYTSADEIDGTGTLPDDGAFDGTGRWIPLVRHGRSLVPGMSVDEVLVYTRVAGDRVGATKMDRPEDVQPGPVRGTVYAALTNNTARGGAGAAPADEVNPRNANKHGHILELVEDRGDHGAETFTWSLPIVCGDPKDPSTYFAGFDKALVSPISCPDNLAFDPAGNLWISTDGNALGAHDGLFAVPLAGPDRGYVRQFLSVPTGAETCGPFVTADGRTVLAAVQHPGEVDGASVDEPASHWPDGDLPRPAVVCVWRPDGAPAGS